MKMVLAVIRPEKVYDVVAALGEAGYNASTRWQVSGRGRQKGIQVGSVTYDEIIKSAVMVIVDDSAKNEVIDVIMDAAKTSEDGNTGDGKVFVLAGGGELYNLQVLQRLSVKWGTHEEIIL